MCPTFAFCSRFARSLPLPVPSSMLGMGVTRLGSWLSILDNCLKLSVAQLSRLSLAWSFTASAARFSLAVSRILESCNVLTRSLLLSSALDYLHLYPLRCFWLGGKHRGSFGPSASNPCA